MEKEGEREKEDGFFVGVLKKRKRNNYRYLVLTVLSSSWKVSKNDLFTVHKHVEI